MHGNLELLSLCLVMLHNAPLSDCMRTFILDIGCSGSCKDFNLQHVLEKLLLSFQGYGRPIPVGPCRGPPFYPSATFRRFPGANVGWPYTSTFWHSQKGNVNPDFTQHHNMLSLSFALMSVIPKTWIASQSAHVCHWDTWFCHHVSPLKHATMQLSFKFQPSLPAPKQP